MAQTDAASKAHRHKLLYAAKLPSHTASPRGDQLLIKNTYYEKKQ
jgi:hypothetical protein